jgi:hypothetical protein
MKLIILFLFISVTLVVAQTKPHFPYIQNNICLVTLSANPADSINKAREKGAFEDTPCYKFTEPLKTANGFMHVGLLAGWLTGTDFTSLTNDEPEDPMAMHCSPPATFFTIPVFTSLGLLTGAGYGLWKGHKLDRRVKAGESVVPPKRNLGYAWTLEWSESYYPRGGGGVVVFYDLKHREKYYPNRIRIDITATEWYQPIFQYSKDQFFSAIQYQIVVNAIRKHWSDRWYNLHYGAGLGWSRVRMRDVPHGGRYWSPQAYPLNVLVGGSIRYEDYIFAEVEIRRELWGIVQCSDHLPSADAMLYAVRIGTFLF